MGRPLQLVALMSILRDGETLAAEQSMPPPRNTVLAFKVQEDDSPIRYVVEVWDEEDMLSSLTFAGSDEAVRQFVKLVGPVRIKHILEDFSHG